jgi:hypothetical protein
MMPLDASTFLLQWATGGLLFCWVTTRRREVSLGYGWLLRGVYGLFAAAGAAVGFLLLETVWVRDLAGAGVAVAAFVVNGIAGARRKAGVAGQQALAEERSARVAAMTGIDRAPADKDVSVAEFDPRLDLVAPAIGAVGIVASGVVDGDPVWLAVARLLVGAAFLGVVSDSMLLGHWYLVQPGMPRAPLLELVRWAGYLWVPELILWLVPTGMVSVLNGTIDDQYNGLLGWFWLACAVTTGGLLIVTRLALKERAYSAVMAATGLLYLAILTAFGMDVVARALLAP